MLAICRQTSFFTRDPDPTYSSLWETYQGLLRSSGALMVQGIGLDGRGSGRYFADVVCSVLVGMFMADPPVSAEVAFRRAHLALSEGRADRRHLHVLRPHQSLRWPSSIGWLVAELARGALSDGLASAVSFQLGVDQAFVTGVGNLCVFKLVGDTIHPCGFPQSLVLWEGGSVASSVMGRGGMPCPELWSHTEPAAPGDVFVLANANVQSRAAALALALTSPDPSLACAALVENQTLDTPLLVLTLEDVAQPPIELTPATVVVVTDDLMLVEHRRFGRLTLRCPDASVQPGDTVWLGHIFPARALLPACALHLEIEQRDGRRRIVTYDPNGVITSDSEEDGPWEP